MAEKEKLDKIFSQYIRLRDSNEDGFGQCISCGKIVHWKLADAGHYINRKHMSLRYNEKNVNLQCRYCNRFDEGNKEGYIKGLTDKYGSQVLDELLAAKFRTTKFTQSELKILTKFYQSEVKRLLKEKL